MNTNLFVGCASGIIYAPLFAELYGYGPFLGRRNRGVRDPLYCRAASFFDGRERVIVIGNDLVTMDPEGAREIKTRISEKTGVPSKNIMVCGSHTHSGPTVSFSIGWGEVCPEFAAGWKNTAVTMAIGAVADETPVTLSAASAPLKETLAYNRVVQDGPTDPDIRLAAFFSPNGEIKLLIHNHGMHGVVFGKTMKKVSADWPGAVNAAIIDRGLARNVLFLQGASGDINPLSPCLGEEEGEKRLASVTDVYVATLAAGLKRMAPIAAAPVRAITRKSEMPVEDVTPEYLREMAPKLRERNAYQADRMEEMALQMENGGDIGISTDLQTLRVGDLYLYAIGGEPFYELGRTLIARSPGAAAMVASIANDNLKYIPTPEVFAKHPDILSFGPGYYECRFAGFVRYRGKYVSDIAPFLVDKYLRMANEMA